MLGSDFKVTELPAWPLAEVKLSLTSPVAPSPAAKVNLSPVSVILFVAPAVLAIFNPPAVTISNLPVTLPPSVLPIAFVIVAVAPVVEAV